MAWAYRARARAESRGWFRTAGAIATVAASARTRRPVRVRWDGADWEHRWSGGYLVTGEPTSTPAMTLTQDLPLYFHGYRPGPGDVVVDCGAGAGVEMRALSALVGPTGRVLAVEPDPSAYRRLGKAAGRLPVANVTLVNAAVSDAEGWAALADLGHPNAINNHLVRIPGGAAADHGAASVEVTTLARLCRDLPRVDLLLMNIEGEEARALAGLGECWPLVRHVAISCHDFLGRPHARTHDAVVALLEGQGMRILAGPPAPPGSVASYYVFAARQSR
jgi:FkbM family methyltransferase